jgi:hypothetical protein
MLAALEAVITYYDDIKQGSKEWLEAREKMYTGSNADKLLTSSQYVRIENGIITNYAHAGITEFKGNFWTKRGHLLEDEAIELYELIKNVVVRKTGYITNSLFPGCMTSPDGIDGDWFLEVKSFGEKEHRKILNGEISFKIQAQIYYGMLIAGKKKGRLLAYCPQRDADGNPIFSPKDQLKIIDFTADIDIENNFRKKIGVTA